MQVIVDEGFSIKGIENKLDSFASLFKLESVLKIGCRQDTSLRVFAQLEVGPFTLREQMVHDDFASAVELTLLLMKEKIRKHYGELKPVLKENCFKSTNEYHYEIENKEDISIVKQSDKEAAFELEMSSEKQRIYWDLQGNLKIIEKEVGNRYIVRNIKL